VRRLLTSLSIVLFALAAVRGARADAPSIMMTYPSANAIIDQAAAPTILLQAVATDPDETISSVTFLVCGPGAMCWTPVGRVASAPFHVRWALPLPTGDPSIATTASYQVSAVAENVLGQTRQADIVSFTVLQPPMPSSVTLVAPNGPNGEVGFITPASPVLYATAYNNTVPTSTIDHVDFLDGSTVIGTVPTPNAVPGGYAFVWQGAPVGIHLIVARATNSLGYSAVSSPLTVFVIEPDPPPQVTLTSPMTGQVFGPVSTMPLTATATSALGTIQRVEFMTRDTVIATALSPPYSANWVNPPAGNFAIVARAFDDVGVAAASAAAYVQVLATPRAPGVVLTAPAPGATFASASTLPIVATALAPDSSIGRVDFYAGETLLGSVLTAPYEFAWTNLTPGAQLLTAKAYDVQGNMGISTPVAVTVTMTSHQPPTVNLTAPSENSTYGAPAIIALSSTAAATGASIAKVEFFANTTLVASVTAPPFNATWKNVAAGRYALTAKATDSLGAMATSTPVTVTVNANQPPQVTLTTPVDGQTFAGGDTISLSAAASDPDGTIVRVEFYVDTALVGSATSAPYGTTWSSAVPGRHVLLAKAVDDHGLATTSTSIAIQVATQALTIATPAAGASVMADFVLVSGTYRAPPNSGVTVNDVVARTDGQGHYFVNNLPLIDGINTLSVTLTTPDGQTTTQTQTITRTGVAPMQIHAEVDGDFAPGNFTVRVKNRSANRIASVSYQNLGGGQLDTSGMDQTTIGTITYTSPGIYTPTITIMDSAGNTYSQSLALLAQDKNALDQMLKAVWRDFANALAVGDIRGATKLLSGGARVRYSPLFTQIAPSLPGAVATWEPPQTGALGNQISEYTVRRLVGGVNRIYFVYFLLDSSGVWQLDSM
jgi:hypothetical protein